MSITDLTGKVFRFIYTLGKWILGVIAIGMLAALALSIYNQSQIRNSIVNGMTRSEVIEELGEPRLELEEPGFCNKGTWQEDCAAAQQSGAVRYLLWKYGIDSYFVIGLDQDSRVVFHDMGDA